MLGAHLPTTSLGLQYDDCSTHAQSERTMLFLVVIVGDWKRVRLDEHISH